MYSTVHPLYFVMMAYGLIGFPLSHSFSPAYFAKKFASEGINATYELFPLREVKELPQLLQSRPDLQGLNVTIPHKQGVIPFINELSPDAQSIGAVNCIKIAGNKTTGYNTDAEGFRESLAPLLQSRNYHALILGTGGASLAVAFALSQLGISYTYVSRIGHDGVLSYDDLSADMIAAHQLIVNTTPLGMYPHTALYPDIPYDGIGKAHLLYDLIYNPAETLFLEKGKAQGAVIKNGLEMLELQAEASWRIWNT